MIQENTSNFTHVSNFPDPAYRLLVDNLLNVLAESLQSLLTKYKDCNGHLWCPTPIFCCGH